MVHSAPIGTKGVINTVKIPTHWPGMLRVCYGVWETLIKELSQHYGLLRELIKEPLNVTGKWSSPVRNVYKKLHSWH